MEGQNPNINPQEPQPFESEAEKKGVGSTVAIVIIVLVLALGALYILGQTKPVGAPEGDSLPPLNSSDDVSSLEADLGNTPADLGDLNLDDLEI